MACLTELCKPLHYDKAIIHEGGSENISVYARGCGFVSTQVSKQLNETDSMLLCNISMSFISELNQGESHFGRTSV